MAYRNMSLWEKIQDGWSQFIGLPKSRLIAGAAVLGVILYVVFSGAYGRQYHKDVFQEMQIAKALCENSRGIVMRDLRQLKIGNGLLRQVKVNRETRDFELIDYPRIIFTDTGFSKINNDRNTNQQIFCSYKDPRSGKNFFYRYETGQWVDKVRMRR